MKILSLNRNVSVKGVTFSQRYRLPPDFHVVIGRLALQRGHANRLAREWGDFKIIRARHRNSP
jgi:hypothetical protein